MSIPAWARVGAKVVCVNAGRFNAWHLPMDADERVVEGEVYTISRAMIDDDGDAILHLVEVRRNAASRRALGPDVGYWAARFRPLITQSDDISAHFQQFLSNTEREEV
jgi:hypothetical protein